MKVKGVRHYETKVMSFSRGGKVPGEDSEREDRANYQESRLTGSTEELYERPKRRPSADFKTRHIKTPVPHDPDPEWGNIKDFYMDDED